MISSMHCPASLSIQSPSSRPCVVLLGRNAVNCSQSKRNPYLKTRFGPPKCSVSLAQPAQKQLQAKPSPAEVSRTIMELSSLGTLSTLTSQGWPLGIGVQFVVDSQGVPVLLLNTKNGHMSTDKRSSLHVQLEQCGSRSPQCTLIGSLGKPEDKLILRKLHELWVKKFGEKINEDLLYLVDVDRLLQMEYPMEDGVWVTLAEYEKAKPDPLRNCAQKLVNEMNSANKEDVHRFCDIYVELGFEVKDAKMVWVDRIGFDVHIHSSHDRVYEVRIPFPREVTDERGAKSSFNCMSQVAWEVEKNHMVPDFEKVRHLKEISYDAH